MYFKPYLSQLVYCIVIQV